MTTCGIFVASRIVFGQFRIFLETLGRRIVLSTLEDGHHEPIRPSVGTLEKTGEEQWKGQMFDPSNRGSVKTLTLLRVTNMATFRTSVDQQPWPPPSPASRFPGHIGLLGSLGPLWPSWGSLRRLLGRCWGPLGPLKLSWAVLGSVWAVVGSSWGPLGPSCGDLGGLWDRVGPSWVLAPISSRAQPWPNSAPPPGSRTRQRQGRGIGVGIGVSSSPWEMPRE